MNSRITAVTLITAVLSAGALMANPATPQPHRERGARFEHLASALNLTDQQKQQAQGIFKSERESVRPVRQELREDRKAVQAAIQSGKSAPEVAALAKNEGPALGKLAAARADGFAKFYAVLTPAQKQKLAEIHKDHSQRQHPVSPSGVRAANS